MICYRLTFKVTTVADDGRASCFEEVKGGGHDGGMIDAVELPEGRLFTIYGVARGFRPASSGAVDGAKRLDQGSISP